MNVEITVSTDPDYLRITALGQYSFNHLFEFIDRVKSEAEQAAATRVLMDCRQVIGRMAEVDRFSGGKRIAEVFGGRIKAVLLMRTENITKLGELAAVNRGARFFVTDSEPEALRWLLSENETEV